MNQRTWPTGIVIASFLLPIVFANSFHHHPTVAAAVKTSKINSDPFYSDDGRFSINFPNQPTTINKKNEADGTITYIFNVFGERSFYQVAYSDILIPPNLTRPELIKVLSDIPPAYAQGLEAKLVETKDVQLGEHPGLEFRFSRSGQTGWGRTYVVGTRLYIVTSMGNPPKATSSFLNSFDLR
jgi:hypothetical protein